MSPVNLSVDVLMLLNISWFGVASCFFSVKARSAARMILPSALRHEPLLDALAYAIRFLAGMNLAFAVLSALILVDPAGFGARQKAWLLAVLAVAHASQFAFNLPHALRLDRMPGASAPGLNAPMWRIFTIDGLLMAANAILCVVIAVQG